jgi:hypothetical protein
VLCEPIGVYYALGLWELVAGIVRGSDVSAPLRLSFAKACVLPIPLDYAALSPLVQHSIPAGL